MDKSNAASKMEILINKFFCFIRAYDIASCGTPSFKTAIVEILSRGGKKKKLESRISTFKESWLLTTLNGQQRK